MTTTARTLPEQFLQQVQRRRDALALRYKAYGIWHRVTWNEYAAQVRKVAAALLAFGLRKQENVAILGDNRPEWPYCHLGTMSAGGVTCGIYATSAPEQIKYLLNHSEARVLFLENEEQLEKALQVVADTRVERVVVWDAKGLWGYSDERVQFFDDFLKQGEKYIDTYPGSLEERLAAVQPDDTAMIIYTSGTTGAPKGAMLSHRSIIWTVGSAAQAIRWSPEDEVISFLPFAHIFENYTSVFNA
ncbi:MAG: AMP-binding protein, partial [Candidatus Rokubacteria bacterium]|nr:AMP-binding protein [Candidatus Rokubacteria bacterium]